ncbi:MAG: hypothetical protein MRY59_00050 [Aquisalinus sp.]|nr:hypothetical protein [Aquisalinus sp.]
MGQLAGRHPEQALQRNAQIQDPWIMWSIPGEVVGMLLLAQRDTRTSFLNTVLAMGPE